jgi:hypothetical protein
MVNGVESLSDQFMSNVIVTGEVHGRGKKNSDVITWCVGNEGRRVVVFVFGWGDGGSPDNVGFALFPTFAGAAGVRGVSVPLDLIMVSWAVAVIPGSVVPCFRITNFVDCCVVGRRRSKVFDK